MLLGHIQICPMGQKGSPSAPLDSCSRFHYLLWLYSSHLSDELSTVGFWKSEYPIISLLSSSALIMRSNRLTLAEYWQSQRRSRSSVRIKVARGECVHVDAWHWA